MGAYKKIVITDIGNALLAKVMAGQMTLKFSKSRISSYIYPEGTDFKKMTDLQDVRHEAIPSNVNVINDTTVLARVLFGNEKVSEKYLIQNIGLYALDGDKEILFSVSQAVTPDEMPTYNGVAPSSFIYDISIPVAQASTINLTVDPAGTATTKDIMDLDEKKVDSSGGDISTTVTTVEEPSSLADKYPEISGKSSMKTVLGKLLWWVKSLNADKVDKEDGKGLSANDYTDKEKKALAGKVDKAGGDIADTKVASLEASAAQYPVPAAGDTTKIAFGKVKKFFEDIGNWMTGVCLIGQIVNNCVTNRADLPLSAAQGKALMDLYNVLNANTSKTGHTHDDRYYTETEMATKLKDGSGNPSQLLYGLIWLPPEYIDNPNAYFKTSAWNVKIYTTVFNVDLINSAKWSAILGVYDHNNGDPLGRQLALGTQKISQRYYSSSKWSSWMNI